MCFALGRRGSGAAARGTGEAGYLMPIRMAAVLVLCVFSGACGDRNPFASFDTRCAKLPSTHFEVVAVPLTFERDDSQNIAALTVKSGSALATHRTLGLTTAVFGQSTDIQLNVVDDRRGERACGTPRVRVELSMQPVKVFVASELPAQSCQHEATLSHEMKHVEVFREALDLAAQDLERDFPDAIGVELRQAKTPGELQQRFLVSVRNYLADFMRHHQRMLDEAQAAVDSPEEYERVSTACLNS